MRARMRQPETELAKSYARFRPKPVFTSLTLLAVATYSDCPYPPLLREEPLYRWREIILCARHHLDYCFSYSSPAVRGPNRLRSSSSDMPRSREKAMSFHWKVASGPLHWRLIFCNPYVSKFGPPVAINAQVQKHQTSSVRSIQTV